jgi:hypothetical protein
MLKKHGLLHEYTEIYFFCAEFCVRGKRYTSDSNLNISTSNPPLYGKQQINKKKQLYLHAVTRSYLYNIQVDSQFTDNAEILENKIVQTIHFQFQLFISITLSPN